MTIKETSEITGFSAFTLRYYEKEGILQDIDRDESGYRKYSNKDVDILKFLSCLKKAEMSVKDINEFTDLLYSGDSTIEERVLLLEKQEVKIKAKLAETKEVYDHIKLKIKYYKGQL
ncbi:MAG: MerR family transcriptional regulator [Spirochaetaceae bacterium]